jgi:hypothetical protein
VEGEHGLIVSRLYGQVNLQLKSLWGQPGAAPLLLRITRGILVEAFDEIDEVFKLAGVGWVELPPDGFELDWFAGAN